MRLLVAVVCATLAGCVTARTYRSGPFYPPTRQATVAVYFDAAEITQPYEVLGTILAEGSSGWFVEEGDVIDEVRKRAARLGAHAVIITREKSASHTAALLIGSNDRKQRAQAIRFRDPNLMW